MEFECWADDDYDITGADDTDAIEMIAEEDAREPPADDLDADVVDTADDYVDEPADTADTADEFMSEVLTDDIYTVENTAVLMIVPNDDRRCSNMMTRYEVTEIINIRSRQIAKYANCLVDTSGVSDPIMQAWMELYARRTPLIIRRVLGERKSALGTYQQYAELWRPCEMTIPKSIRPIRT